MKPDKTNARIQLNMDVTLGKKLYQGSLIKNNMTSLANNISLEIDQQMEQKPFKVLGTPKCPKDVQPAFIFMMAPLRFLMASTNLYHNNNNNTFSKNSQILFLTNT